MALYKHTFFHGWLYGMVNPWFKYMCMYFIYSCLLLEALCSFRCTGVMYQRAFKQTSRDLQADNQRTILTVDVIWQASLWLLQQSILYSQQWQVHKFYLWTDLKGGRHEHFQYYFFYQWIVLITLYLITLFLKFKNALNGWNKALKNAHFTHYCGFFRFVVLCVFTSQVERV